MRPGSPWTAPQPAWHHAARNSINLITRTREDPHILGWAVRRNPDRIGTLARDVSSVGSSKRSSTTTPTNAKSRVRSGPYLERNTGFEPATFALARRPDLIAKPSQD